MTDGDGGSLSRRDRARLISARWHSKHSVWSRSARTSPRYLNLAFRSWQAESQVQVPGRGSRRSRPRSEEHTSELQSLAYLVCRLLLEKKKNNMSPCSA